MCIYMCVFVYIYTHTHTHTHTLCITGSPHYPASGLPIEVVTRKDKCNVDFCHSGTGIRQFNDK